MNTKTPLNELLAKDVSRQEFLVLLATGLVALVGFSSIIHFLTGKRIGSARTQVQGYGSGGYGR